MYDIQNLVLGRGMLFFEQFAPGTSAGQGERYLGNSPSVAFQVRRETQVYTASIQGVLHTTKSEIISEGATGTCTLDDVSQENLAVFFNAKDSGVAASAGVVQGTITAYRGAYYQVGATASSPLGRRNMSAITLLRGTTPLAANQYEVDLANGRIRISPTAAVTPGESLTLRGTALATDEAILVPSSVVVTGALRFVSDTLYGKGQDFFFPLVEIQPAGDFQLKGETWQELRFDITARKRPRYNLYYVATRG